MHSKNTCSIPVDADQHLERHDGGGRRGRRVRDPAGVGSLEQRINSLPIVRHLRMAIEIGVDGVATARLTQEMPFHGGGLETEAVNGGIILCLLDAVIVAAGMVEFPGRRCATVEMAVKFMKPVRATGLRAVGRLMHRSSRLAFTEGRILDERGSCRAMATGILARLG